MVQRIDKLYRFSSDSQDGIYSYRLQHRLAYIILHNTTCKGVILEGKYMIGAVGDSSPTAFCRYVAIATDASRTLY